MDIPIKFLEDTLKGFDKYYIVNGNLSTIHCTMGIENTYKVIFNIEGDSIHIIVKSYEGNISKASNYYPLDSEIGILIKNIITKSFNHINDKDIINELLENTNSFIYGYFFNPYQNSF